MGCTYVKEFDFGTKKSDGGAVKYAMGGAVKYAKGGSCDSGYAKGGKVQAPGFKGQTMIADKSSLGIKGNKNPGVKGSKPVAPNLPTMKLAKGGAVVEKATGEKYPSREAMVKHEKMETPRMQREELTERSQVKMPAIRRKMVPVAPSAPLVAMKSGGKVNQAKVGKVMGEFKAGDLHSGSKKGPEVISRKQAMAIAMSEGRKASKR
ncbi:hypothetical protein UFOVP126_11 [uncultured Caudovirales phage]|uniref:Uncharacterized protein n=1 Tax=uncultured Caudovirales phage TaxID=2100421 RepID=A0A6J5L872_9CAUD|nr:hypothetical protein UFOVP126_11 [uncultured Caudovirales phage]